ncbi:MAG: hypothetical protein WAN62_19020, partial [Candidatus Acidiferrum sp.]
DNRGVTEGEAAEARNPKAPDTAALGKIYALSGAERRRLPKKSTKPGSGKEREELAQAVL